MNGRRMACGRSQSQPAARRDTNEGCARLCLISITRRRDMTLFEVDEAPPAIREEVDADATSFWCEL